MKSAAQVLCSLLLVAFVVTGCSKKEPAATAKSDTSSKAAAATPAVPTGPVTDAQIVETYGWYVGSRIGLGDLSLTGPELESLLKGMRTAAEGGKEPLDLNTVGPQMDVWVRGRQAAAATKIRDKNTAEATAYFAKLKENKKVVELPSGLRYEIISQGSGPAPKATDTVKVHYEGKFIDGSIFDSSRQRGEPAEFPLNGVIAGWTEGLQKVNKGGTIKLYVPSNLAYGDQGRPGMPPASTLIFDVELLDVTAVPAAEPTLKIAP